LDGLSKPQIDLICIYLFCSFPKLLPIMRKVILIFPDVTSISEFLLTYKVSRAIVDSTEKKLKGIMSDKHLSIACRQYGAKIKESIAIKCF